MAMTAKLFVRNIPLTTREPSLHALFNQAGTVSALTMPIDAHTGQPRGYAFVIMSSPVEAKRAIAMFHKHEFGGKALAVSASQPPEARPATGSRKGLRRAVRAHRTRLALPAGERARTLHLIKSSADKRKKNP
jgi:RNA recognition motif-containing protein